MNIDIIDRSSLPNLSQPECLILILQYLVLSTNDPKILYPLM